MCPHCQIWEFFSEYDSLSFNFAWFLQIQFLSSKIATEKSKILLMVLKSWLKPWHWLNWNAMEKIKHNTKGPDSAGIWTLQIHYQVWACTCIQYLIIGTMWDDLLQMVWFHIFHAWPFSKNTTKLDNNCIFW